MAAVLLLVSSRSLKPCLDKSHLIQSLQITELSSAHITSELFRTDVTFTFPTCITLRVVLVLSCSSAKFSKCGEFVWAYIFKTCTGSIILLARTTFERIMVSGCDEIAHGP